MTSKLLYYKVGDSFNIKIKVDTEKSVDFKNLVYIIEDKLNIVFKPDYDNIINGRRVSKEQYTTFLDTILSQVKSLVIEFKNDETLVLISENKLKINLTEHLISSIF